VKKRCAHTVATDCFYSVNESLRRGVSFRQAQCASTDAREVTLVIRTKRKSPACWHKP